MRSIIYTPLLALAMLSCTTTPQEQFYTQHVTFSNGATIEEKVDMVSRLVPSEQQLAWQQLELTAFIHFGMNTFTGNEWGDGTDSPEIFNPTELDCDQWVRTLKEGGFKMVILTAKHHDGFCLWPTATTEYSVKQSPWRNGEGDVVRELRDACTKHDMKFGFYLSPWDRNAECYGNSEAYNQLYIAQLTELLTDYGRVDEVWFDGACGEGPNGKKQVYDWPAILSCVKELQPHAVTAIMGDDIRWVGNEGGVGRDTEWSATMIAPGSYVDRVTENRRLGLEEMSKDLGSRELLAKANEAYWYPSEVDVSIRPGWFYHEEQDSQVRSLANLVNIYYRSVGSNSVLLLNIPPDCRGLIHENDAQRIKEFGEYLKNTFENNYIVRGNKPWRAKAGDSKEYKANSAVVNTVLLQEDIAKGQRVESFKVEGFENGEWRELCSGTTIGYKRLLRFEECHPERLRITINESRNDANIKNVGLYYTPPIEE
ncbi:MAG: alpha-L-fucosidase [Alistipes sp.]|nr:alpha-L-fucosidase [Alistipes sp.]